MNIEDLVKSYKTVEELQIYCQSQFKQILALSKKVKDLEEKNESLSKQAKQSSALSIVPPSDGLITLPTGPLATIKDDAKIISQIQLNMLKEVSFERELTLDEAKRVEIFNKIANAHVEKQKPLKADAKTVDTDDLLSLIETDNGR